MNLSRRSLMLTGAAAVGASILAPRARAELSGDKKHLIVLFAYGGWDTTYALDPKPGLATVDAPSGAVTMFGELPIYTNLTRPSVTSFFQKYGAITAVINGIQVRSLNHPDCSKRILTGTQSDASPDLGSIVAYELGRSLPAPYLVLGPSAYSGPLASIATRAGTVNQLRSLLDPAAAFPKAAPFDTPRYAADGAESDLIRQYLLARTERERATRGQLGYNAARFEDFLSSLERRDVLKGFSDGFGDDFTFTLDLNMQIGLALDAIERGVCHSVHLEQAFATWDTHANNAPQDTMHEQLYAALTLLVDQLAARPGSQSGRTMLDDTVVAVFSEMGRTPKLNAAGGKDHWPVTSALVLGSGVRGGRVYGASDNQLQAMNVDLHSGAPDPNGEQLQYGNLAAGILTLAGVDPAPYLANLEVFDAIVA
ncbi:MAG TPA: DUF1501 domain-containing protein [Polyangiaceae bacterium]|nr:DUF1501 domain-containing protein [Polyangiaceae bacterium]